MSENKRSRVVSLFLPEIGCMLVAALGIYLLEYFGILKQEMDRTICDIVLVILGIGVVGFELRIGAIREELTYDNRDHIGRFWLCFLLGLAIAFSCVFLPAGAWPFLAVFVLLGLFGSKSVGALAGAVLLVIPVLLTESGIEIFVLYLVSGMFGIVIFGNIKSEIKIGRSFFLSLGCLLVCITAGTVLIVNSRPTVEDFLVPVVNLIVSGLLLFGILKYFSTKIMYRFRERYLDLNDSENELLTNLKGSDRGKYMRIVHTTHFCESISHRLGMDQDALKCAGYYYQMGEQLTELMEKKTFPPEVEKIFEDYFDKKSPVKHKETAVLIAADEVVGKILSLLEATGNGTVDYDRVIDEIFVNYQESGMFDECDITMWELRTMHRIFKEEKLYYDFLR